MKVSKGENGKKVKKDDKSNGQKKKRRGKVEEDGK